MASLRSLEGRLNNITRRLVRGISKTVEEIGTAVGEDLVDATPVLTGFAKGNWRPSLNAPAAFPITVLDPTGSGTKAKITAVAKRARAGDTLFITNSAPYISALNAGSSPQADALFVETAVATGTERALNKLRNRGLF
jgi:hypothetical protein